MMKGPIIKYIFLLNELPNEPAKSVIFVNEDQELVRAGEIGGGGGNRGGWCSIGPLWQQNVNRGRAAMKYGFFIHIAGSHWKMGLQCQNARITNLCPSMLYKVTISATVEGHCP